MFVCRLFVGFCLELLKNKSVPAPHCMIGLGLFLQLPQAVFLPLFQFDQDRFLLPSHKDVRAWGLQVYRQIANLQHCFILHHQLLRMEVD